MLVLNTNSNTESVSAPNACPSITVPSSNTRVAIIANPFNNSKMSRPISNKTSKTQKRNNSQKGELFRIYVTLPSYAHRVQIIGLLQVRLYKHIGRYSISPIKYVNTNLVLIRSHR